MRTAVGTIPAAPLVLLDVTTEEDIIGQSYLAGYIPTSLAPMVKLVDQLAVDRKGKPVFPLERMREKQQTMSCDSGATTPTRFPRVTVDDHRVAGVVPSVEIHVRNKRLQSLGCPDKEKVVVSIHGATYPGNVAVDHPMFGGGSWLDYLALHGFDAYLFDVRGYDRSSRPSLQSGNPARDLPYARTPEAVADLGTVVNYVRERTQVFKVNLLGWSWGTAVSGGFVAEHNELMRHLVMVLRRCGPFAIPPSCQFYITYGLMLQTLGRAVPFAKNTSHILQPKGK